MSKSKPSRLSFPVQILTTAIIVAGLVWAARLSSSADAEAFDEAAERRGSSSKGRPGEDGRPTKSHDRFNH